MDAAFIEAVTIEEIMTNATWNRQRTSAELQAFIESHHSALPENLTIE